MGRLCFESRELGIRKLYLRAYHDYSLALMMSLINRGVEQPLHPKPTDHAAADPLGERGQIGWGGRSRRQERRCGVAPCFGSSRPEGTVGRACVQVGTG